MPTFTGGGIPSALQVATLQNYVSSTNFHAGLSIHEPDVSEDFVKRYGNQGITGFLDMISAKAPVAQKEYYHYEEDFIHQNVTVTAENTGLASTDGREYALNVASDEVIGAIDGGDNAADVSCPLRIGNIVQNHYGETGVVVAIFGGKYGNAGTFMDGYATGVTGGTAAANDQIVFHVLSYDGTIMTAPANGDTLIIIGMEFAEATGQPSGLTPQVIEYKNNTMIMKESYRVSGSEATNKIWFEVEDESTGQRGYLWYLKGEGDTYKRFMDYCEMQMLLGNQADAAAEISTSTNLKGSEGLIPFIRNNGNTHNYNQLGGFNLGDFDAMIRTLDRFRGSRENTIFAGIDLSLAIDDAVAAMFAGGGISYGAFNGAEEIAVAMGFKSFMRGGYVFHKKTYEALSHFPMLGAANFEYPGMGIVIPGDNGKDARTGDNIPSLRIRYKEAGGYSREMEHWLTGSAGLEQATSEVDELRCHYRTERGFEGFAPNRFFLIERV
tara:strand:+ start:4295 stop:5782 length:1488 start_codon:yes stop_codon:yes gene_type:complete